MTCRTPTSVREQTLCKSGLVSACIEVYPWRRRFRDVHALTQRFLVKLDTLTTVGAVLAVAKVDLTVF
jgi:hypothetical protein